MKSDLTDKYLVSLNWLNSIGPATLKKLIKKLNSPEAVFKASFFDLRKAGLEEKIIHNFIAERQKIDPDKIIAYLAKENIQVITLTDKNYPMLLKEIYAPPLALYYRGNAKLFNWQLNLAVVGSRKISTYSQMVMPKLLNPVITRGVNIISGCALGVDTLAHQLALANNGQTIAVIGSGLNWNCFYPQSNVNLAQEIIAKGGLIISEYPPHLKAQTFHFPLRNRIIAGLANAVLIMEAAQKSGALLTAAYALEQNREVLAVPQNINALNAAGVDNLIKNGAKVITSSNDILEIFGLEPGQMEIELKLPNLSAEEIMIYKLLSSEPQHIDKIAENATLDTAIINASLMQLELKGLVKNLGNQCYLKL
ncbi:MAG: DNA-processing protein DprA [Candidatus Komeilibacteria bacterium]|nr:DNA-processing protein DprA [Candidatus Komeilibacteria bacterium]